MILITAIKLMILLAYQGSQMFGVLIINTLVDAIFDHLEDWSVKRAEPAIIIVQGA